MVKARVVETEETKVETTGEVEWTAADKAETRAVKKAEKEAEITEATTVTMVAVATVVVAKVVHSSGRHLHQSQACRRT